MYSFPFYQQPTEPQLSLRKSSTVHMMAVVDFLKWVTTKDELEIAHYLKDMQQEPFFLVAATGLGKTVVVPVHVLLRQMERSGKTPTPRVWVVEPRIPIAVDQAAYMNSLWNEYCTKHSRTRRQTAPLFGCITSASGRVNRDAPVQFITTGIFELLASNGELDPINDRVIIDEAHVTVEQNPGVELGIALCRKAGVTVDYMSATVDTANLQTALHVASVIRADKVRNVIWKSNLQLPIDEAIVALVEGTLVHPQKDSGYYPDTSYPDRARVLESVLESGRSHGMLIVVNSFNGDTSDTKNLTAKLQKHHPSLAVLHLASDVIRDPKREREFKQRLASIERRHENYIIIATSVVEMGITFPTLDYVVTMDSGYDQETIGDVSFPVVAPLGVNSLLQRIGRVGRRRPGIAYISNEVDADYSSLDDRALNQNALAYEPIRFPLATAPLLSLAYYASCQPDRAGIDEWLKALDLPSKIHENQERMTYFDEQVTQLETLGITKNGTVTELGKRMSSWIGRADITYATQLQRRLSEKAWFGEVLFWLVATALSNTSITSLRAQYSYFSDYGGVHSALPERIDIWEYSICEDLATFMLIGKATEVAPRYLWDEASRSQLTELGFYKWCNWVRLNDRKVLKAAKAITEAFRVFEKANRDSHEFNAVFGENCLFEPSMMDWLILYYYLPVDDIIRQQFALSSFTTVHVNFDESMKAFTWQTLDARYSGIINQDDTPIELIDGDKYKARLIPSRANKGDKITWRLCGIVRPILGDPFPEE